MEIVQSFIYSVSRVELTLYEQRILLKVVEFAQSKLKGRILKNSLFRMEHDLDNVRIEIPVRYILSDGSKHYEDVREAAVKLMGRHFEFWDTNSGAWYSSPLIYNVAYVEGGGLLSFYVSKMLFDIILDFTKGFCRYDLETALSLSSPYAVRMYALIASQSRPIVYSIVQLKKMFGVENKYKQTRDFLIKVIDAAKKILDDAQCNSFTYSKIKNGKKVESICIAPLKRRQLTPKELAAKVSLKRLIDHEILVVLISYMGFTTKEISAHKILLNEFCKLPYATDTIYNIERRYRKGKKTKGYVIAAIRDEVDNFKRLQDKKDN